MRLFVASWAAVRAWVSTWSGCAVSVCGNVPHALLMEGSGRAHGDSRSILAVDGSSGRRIGLAVDVTSSTTKASAVRLWEKKTAAQRETSPKAPRSRVAICVHAEVYRCVFDYG